MNAMHLVTDILRAIGYTPVGNGVYRGRSLRCEITHDWLTWTSPADPAPESLLAPASGPAGPWKLVLGTPRNCWAFHIPAHLLDFEDESEPVLRQILSWPDQAWTGLANWQASCPEALAALAGSEALRVQLGTRIHQGWIDSAPGRLSLHVPLARLPELSGARRAALQDVLVHASRLRLVRVGVEVSPRGRRVAAVVDLAGVPAAIEAKFIEVSVHALRWVVEKQRLIETVSLLAESALESRALNELYAA